MGDKVIIKQQGRFDEDLNESDFRKLIFKEIRNVHKTLNNLPAEYNQNTKKIEITQRMSKVGLSFAAGDSFYYEFDFNAGMISSGEMDLCTVPAGYALKMICLQVITAFPEDNTLRVSDGTEDKVKEGDAFLNIKKNSPFFLFRKYENDTSLKAFFTGKAGGGEGKIIIELIRTVL